jgi:hypothetical protein
MALKFWPTTTFHNRPTQLSSVRKRGLGAVNESGAELSRGRQPISKVDMKNAAPEARGLSPSATVAP